LRQRRVDYSPKTLSVINDLIVLLNKNNIQLPEIKLLEKFSIVDNGGWGKEFTRDEILNEGEG
jgi:hypothetical protein